MFVGFFSLLFLLFLSFGAFVWVFLLLVSKLMLVAYSSILLQNLVSAVSVEREV